MGRGRTQPPAVTAWLPRGPHDQKDAERGQRPGEAQENKITERVGGEPGSPKKEGKEMEVRLGRGGCAVPSGMTGSVFLRAHLPADESIFCSAATL